MSRTHETLNSLFNDVAYAIGEKTGETVNASAYQLTTTGSKAKINSIGGKTVVFNQLVQNGNFADTSVWQSGGAAFSVSGNVATITPTDLYGEISQSFSMVDGHKYFVSYQINRRTIGTGNNNVTLVFSAVNTVKISSHPQQITGWQNVYKIVDGNSTVTRFQFKSMLYEEGFTADIKNAVIFDLTQMFGAGNEPTTVEEFRAMFPLDYYAYNPGELVSADVKSVDSRSLGNAPIHSLEIPQAIQNLTGYGWSAGNVYNEVDYEHKKYIQRVGSVDLGTLAWSYGKASSSDYYRFSADIGNKKVLSTKMICPKYQYKADGTIGTGGMDDKTMAASDSTTVGRIFIRDDSYTDAAVFKTAMSGVNLYYELATPIETDISDIITGSLLLNTEAGGTLTFAQDDYQLPVPVKLWQNGGAVDLNEYVADNFPTLIRNIPDEPYPHGGKNVQIAPHSHRVTSTTMTSCASITVEKTGTYKVSWMAAAQADGSATYNYSTRAYVDGTAIGSAHYTNAVSDTGTDAFIVIENNVSLTAGQVIEVRARSRGSTYYTIAGMLVIEEVTQTLMAMRPLANRIDAEYQNILNEIGE